MTSVENHASHISEGTLVKHPYFGVGKVVQLSAVEAHVYFTNSDGSDLNARVRRFRLPSDFLTATNAQSAEFDHLPAWRDGKFVGAPAHLSLAGAREIFSRHFLDGLDDARFLSQEVAYKRSGHIRWIAARESLAVAAANEDAECVASIVEQIYDGRPNSAATEARLNFLFQRVDEPAFFDALRASGKATSEYAKSVLDFVAASRDDTFRRMVTCLGRLTTRAGKSLESWTMVSWLPFIAAPEQQFLIKPTIVQRFAVSIPFDIRYQPELNFDTYSRCVAMARKLGRWLSASDLNRNGRALDLIDVQSFMWVVERYLPGD